MFSVKWKVMDVGVGMGCFMFRYLSVAILVVFFSVCSYGGREPHIRELGAKDIFPIYERGARALAIAASEGDVARIDELSRQGLSVKRAMSFLQKGAAA